MRVDHKLPEISLVSNIGANNKMISTSGEFSDLLQNAVFNLNDSLNQAGQASILLAQGEIEIHDAMLISEKASLALQLTLAIRSKVIEAYQEVMRMQV